MKYTTAQETYFDLKGIIAYYERLGKTATADFFRGIDESNAYVSHFLKAGELVRHGMITWIPASFVRQWVNLASASPAHAKEVYQEIECHAIQWIPMQEDTVAGIQQSYERAQKIN